MKSQATTPLLLLVVCAVLGPVAAFAEPNSLKMAVVAAQLICLLLVGINMRPAKNNNHPDNDAI